MQFPKVIYFQGNNACFDQYKHHVIDSKIFQENDIIHPNKDLDEICYINEKCYWPHIWIYCKLFHLKRKLDHLPKVNAYFPKFWKASIGGKSDLDALHERLDNVDINSKKILYGVSRGALVVARYASSTNNNLQNVCAIILEGGPISIHEVIKQKVEKIIPFLLLQQFIILFTMAILQLFTNFKSNQENLDDTWVQKLPKNIPILIITSLHDNIVNWEHARKIYAQIKETHNVKLVTLSQVGHNHYSKDPLFYQEVSKFLTKIKQSAK